MSQPQEPPQNTPPDTTPPPASQSEAASSDLEMRLEQETAKAADLYDKLLRTTADFDNFKKRSAKERAESAKYATAPLLRSLVTVLDNLEMALAAATETKDANVQSLQTGVAMIVQQFKQALLEAGLKEVDAQGQSFDPNLHEAVSQFETEEVPEGHVFQQLRKGYRLHDRLLRPASVVVAKAPQTQPAPDAADEPASP